MDHGAPLIETIAIGLVAAFIGGLLAPPAPAADRRLPARRRRGRPVHAGFRRRPELAPQLAELGVILLMFGVGMHFSLARPVGGRGASPSPGRSAQIPLATACGAGRRPCLGLVDRRRPWCSAWPSRWPAPWCCCAR